MNTSHDFTSEDRMALLDTVQRFATQAIAPHVSAWDEAGEFPRSLYHQAATGIEVIGSENGEGIF